MHHCARSLTTALIGLATCVVIDAAEPNLPDLNVTHIARTPRYPAYVLEYAKLPGSGEEAMPIVVDVETRRRLTPQETAAVKRWPTPGERVTFRATVCNHGFAPSGEFRYHWYIDGNRVADGVHESLDGPCRASDIVRDVEIGGEAFKLVKRTPGTWCTIEYQWAWQPGRHYVRFDVDTDDRIDEVCEVNNAVMDATDACSFVMMVDAHTYNTLSSRENHWKSYSFENILQYHRDQMHRKFKASVHPLSPDGILEQIRIDEILIQQTGQRRDRIGAVKLIAGWDSHWDFTGYSKPDDPPDRKFWFLKSQDWGLPHELGHQLGLIDLYCLDTEGGDGGNRVKDENGDPILLSHFTGEQGMMRGHGDRNFSEHSAVALNMQRGRRRGYYGDYLWSLPRTCRVRILDAAGKPIPDARLTFYQHRHRYVVDEVRFTGRTGDDGIFTLPNRDCLEFRTDQGFKLHPNPFGQVNVVGTNGVFFIIAQARGRTDYVWLPITRVNLAYLRGRTDVATFDLSTMLPPENAPPPVSDFRQVVHDGGRTELAWDHESDDTSYTLYMRTNHPPRWEVAPNGDRLTESRFTVHRNGRYAVVAHRGGQESALSPEVRVVLLRDPSGLCLDDRGRWIVRDRGYNQPILYRPDGSTIGVFGTFHLHLRSGGDIARLADGRLVVTANQAGRGPIRVLDSDGFPIHGRHTIGAFGKRPLEFDNPTGITVDSKGHVWVCDTGNARVQVLTEDLGRTFAMTGPNAGLEAPVKVAELPGGRRFAVADGEQVVILELDGNELTPVGTIEMHGRAVYVAASDRSLFIASENPADAGGGVIYQYPIVGDGFAEPLGYSLPGLLRDPKTGRQLPDATPAAVVYDARQDRLIVLDRVHRRIVVLPVLPQPDLRANARLVQ